MRQNSAGWLKANTGHLATTFGGMLPQREIGEWRLCRHRIDQKAKDELGFLGKVARLGRILLDTLLWHDETDEES
jgi:hypothetical protein